MRDARADRSPALLAATDSAPDGHRLPRATVACRSEHTNWLCKGAFGQVAERLWSAEHRRAVGAQRRPLQSKRSGLPGRAFAARTAASCNPTGRAFAAPKVASAADARYKPTMNSP